MKNSIDPNAVPLEMAPALTSLGHPQPEFTIRAPTTREVAALTRKQRNERRMKIYALRKAGTPVSGQTA